DAVDVFGDLFANEPARRHFAEYLTGLMVAEKKTVSGINGAFVVTTDQSCLNRWLNEVTWDVKALNDRRLAWLQGDPNTRDSPRDFTFDSYFTSAKVLNHIQRTQRAYVGDLKLNRKLVNDGREQSLQAVARQIPWQAKKPVRVGNRRYWYFR